MRIDRIGKSEKENEPGRKKSGNEKEKKRGKDIHGSADEKE